MDLSVYSFCPFRHLHSFKSCYFTLLMHRLSSIESYHLNYGIRRRLIGVGSITEVKQRRARFIIGCKSDGSSD